MRERYLHILVLLILAACQAVNPDPSGYGDRNEVPVSLHLTLSPLDLAGPDTRAVDDPANSSDITVRNLCLLQFGGTDENAPLIGKVHYLSDVPDGTDGSHELDLDRIPLADSRGALHTVILLANTFSTVPAPATLGQMKEMFHSVYTPSDLFGSEDEYNDEINGLLMHYQRLNGIAVTEIAAGKSIHAILRRSAVRLRFHIINSGADGLRIQSVQLRNVAEADYYLTDYSYPDPDDGSTAYLFNEPFRDPYIPLQRLRRDFDPVPWTGNADGTGEGDYVLYASANQRGTDATLQTPAEKGSSALATGATYLQIRAVYGEQHDKPILYRFYLGENLTNDFNLRPNTSYSYQIHLAGKGNTVSDNRVEDLSDRHFMVDANCYILNPPPSGTRTYTINVVHRPNVFWGERYGMSEQYPNYYIDATKQWKAVLLWSDFEINRNAIPAFLDKWEGDGSGDYESMSQRIQITLTPQQTVGNITFGIYIDDPSNILWSWHLWITNYQPDDIEGRSPAPREYFYHVKGGEVHHYAGNAWKEGGRYQNGYAMDRYLGAIDNLYHSDFAAGAGMIYQFGRKDPFPARYYVTRYYADWTSTVMRFLTSESVDSGALAETGGKNVPYSVNHPMDFISTRSMAWTRGDIFNPSPYQSNILWQDPKNTVRVDHEETGANADKSFFDPCPPGWRLPVTGPNVSSDSWVVGLSGNSKYVEYQPFPMTGYYEYYCYYYPYGDINDSDAPYVIFPNAGYRSSSASYSTTYNCWTATPSSLANGSYAAPKVNSTSNRCTAYPVRCVKE